MPGISMSVVDQAVGTLKKIEEYVTVGMETIIEVGLDVADIDKESGNNKLRGVRDIMAEYCYMQQQLHNMAEAIKHVKQEAHNDGEDLDLLEVFDHKFKELENAKISPDSHEKMKEMNERIEEIVNPDASEATPSTSQMDEDADFIMTQQEKNTKCPYTGMEMRDPVINKLCGHSYDREGILQFIKTRGKRAKCPVGGCINDKPVEESHLEANKELKRYIDKKNREAGKKHKRNTKT